MEKTLNEEIGKIEKPKADKVIGKKKAFICVLLQAPQEASKELHDLIFKYWEAVDKNISTLEEKTGVVKKIFVEGIPGKGEDVAMNLKEASLGAWNVVEESRKEKLNKNSGIELFSGEFWAGKKAKELGLIDGIGNADQILREKYGDDLEIKKFGKSKGWLSKKLSSSENYTDKVISLLEERSIWQRYGL